MNEFQLIPLTEKNQQYQPQQQQILDYAEYLGFNLPQDQSLLWIAREGLISPLPEGWTALSNNEGEIFFKNESTQKIQVDHPLDEIFRQKYFLEKKKKSIIKNKMEQISLVKINEQNQSSISKTESKYKQSPSFINKNQDRSHDKVEHNKIDSQINKVITQQSQLEPSNLIEQYNLKLSQIQRKYGEYRQQNKNEMKQIDFNGGIQNRAINEQIAVKQQDDQINIKREINNCMRKKVKLEKQLINLEIKYEGLKQSLINKYKQKKRNKRLKKEVSYKKVIVNIQNRLQRKLTKDYKFL